MCDSNLASVMDSVTSHHEKSMIYCIFEGKNYSGYHKEKGLKCYGVLVVFDTIFDNREKDLRQKLHKRDDILV